MAQEFTYYALICYDRKDSAFAARLQRYLERYRMPGKLLRRYRNLPQKLTPIQRRDAAATEVRDGESRRDMLAGTHFLIVLSSEHSARPDANGRNLMDDDIRLFLELHHKHNGSARVVPILLRRKGGPPIADCLLPSLREYDILAADRLDKGENRLMSDVVAKMAGLKPDALWGRQQREQRRRRLLQRLGLATALITAATSALWCWSYFVPQVSCYTDYIERDNLPEGLFELTDEQVRARHRHYRFTSHMHRLRRVEYCNGAGVVQDHETALPLKRPASLELQYNEEGLPERCIHRNAAGQELLICRYAPGTVDFLHSTMVENKRVEVAQSARAVPGSTTAESSVGRLFVQRSQEGEQRGLILRELFCKERSLTPMKDTRGLGGREYTRDNLGRVVEVRHLSVLSPRILRARTAATTTHEGEAGYRLSYNPQGLLNRITFLNTEGNTLSELRLIHDDRGAITSSTLHGADGTPLPKE